MSRTSFSAFRSLLASCVVGVCSLALLAGSPGTATAKKKAKAKGPEAACGLSYLPFVTGTTWKYAFAVMPGTTEAAGIKAKLPEAFQITVKNVESKADGATITLEESYREVVRTTTLTCKDKAGLTVPVESFFFAGELPGAIGMTLEDLKLDGEMYPSKGGLKKGESFYVDVKATVLRAPGGDAKVQHPKSKLEMERQITVGPKEDIEVEHGIHSAFKVGLALSGRLTLESTPDKPVPLPTGEANLWFTHGLGLVRAYNRMGQGWELVTMTNAAGEPIEP